MLLNRLLAASVGRSGGGGSSSGGSSGGGSRGGGGSSSGGGGSGSGIRRSVDVQRGSETTLKSQRGNSCLLVGGRMDG